MTKAEKRRIRFLRLVEIPTVGYSVILQIMDNGRKKTIRTSNVISFEITDQLVEIETRNSIYSCELKDEQDFYSRVLLSFAR